MKRASIDIGSNSVLLLVVEKSSGGSYQELLRMSEVTGLGRGLDSTGFFSNEAMEETEEALTKFVANAEHCGVPSSQIIATATEASRVAKNSSDFFERIRQKIGLRVQIITSEAEAWFSAKGVFFNPSIVQDQIVIMDIGGASTEFIKVQKNPFKVKNTISIPFGAVRVTDWSKNGELDQKLKNLNVDYKESLNDYGADMLYCVAGTMTSVANMILERKTFVEDDVNGFTFNTHLVNDLYKKIEDKSVEQILELYPFLGKRAKTIKGGMKVALSALNWINPQKIYVSTYGLRYGVVLEGQIREDQKFK